jgi:hypothetical protein
MTTFLRRFTAAAVLAAAAIALSAAFAADLSQTPTSVAGFGDQIQGKLGGTVAAGQPVRKQSDGSYVVSTNASAAGAIVDCIALSGGATGQPFTCQKSGNVNLGATLSVGKIYVLSTAGAISPVDDVVATDYMTIICVATTASLCYLAIVNPSPTVQAATDVL